jgi:hypothetical protein
MGMKAAETPVFKPCRREGNAEEPQVIRNGHAEKARPVGRQFRVKGKAGSLLKNLAVRGESQRIRCFPKHSGGAERAEPKPGKRDPDHQRSGKASGVQCGEVIAPEQHPPILIGNAPAHLQQSRPLVE